MVLLTCHSTTVAGSSTDVPDHRTVSGACSIYTRLLLRAPWPVKRPGGLTKDMRAIVVGIHAPRAHISAYQPMARFFRQAQ